jgi:hypothetical protein
MAAGEHDGTSELAQIDASDTSDWQILNGTQPGGLLVLLCGVPGCGKDALGRACANRFFSAAALSQDEHGGDALRTRSAVEGMMCSGRSPLFVLRNSVDAADRSPFVEAAKRHNYRIAAVWPSELSNDDPYRKAALFLASVAGCYCRLTNEGKSGHETLKINDDIGHPAKICLSFLRSFRIPSAVGEVDNVLALPFLQPELADIDLVADGQTDGNCISTLEKQLKMDKGLPKLLSQILVGGLPKVQSYLANFIALRRGLPELIEALTSWVTAQLQGSPGELATTSSSMCPAAAPSKEETRRLQREVKIRSAVEHLLSPTNIASCRANGSTVKNCVWILSMGAHTITRPAWPASHFCGAPQLRKLAVKEEDVLRAAAVSATSKDSLQMGSDGVRVEIIVDPDAEGRMLLSPVEALPDSCLLKLGCPGLEC